MDQDRINKDLLLSRIIHSRDLTALEKRYLEKLVAADGSYKDCNKISAKVGRWVKGIADGDGYHCSVCRIWKQHIIFVHYCPNCGAKMDGGETDVLH